MTAPYQGEIGGPLPIVIGAAHSPRGSWTGVNEQAVVVIYDDVLSRAQLDELYASLAETLPTVGLSL